MQNLFISVTGNQLLTLFIGYFITLLLGFYLILKIKSSSINKVILLLTLAIPILGLGFVFIQNRRNS